MEKPSPCLSDSSTTDMASMARIIGSNAVESSSSTRIRASGFGDPIVQDFKNFRNSSRPARFLAFQENAWVDFPRMVVNELSAGFAAGKAIFELSIDGTCYLFDFLRLVKINMLTEAASSIAWIDVDGHCFFPRAVPGPKMESAKTVDNTRMSVSFRGAEMLREADRLYKTVEKLFLNGMRRVGSEAVVTKVYKCPYSGSSPGDWRLEAFRMAMVTTKEARGDANAKFGWYGASAKDVATLVEHGIGKANSGELGVEAHGQGVHLSPPHFPHGSSLLAQADTVNGERHIVLCRVIMGNSERVEAGSTQWHPSSDEFDSAVDDLNDPKWYVVWTTGMNIRIIPEYIVSFKTYSKPQGRRREVSSAKGPAWQSFRKLLVEIGRYLPSSQIQALEMLFDQHKAGKMSRDIFIKYVRSMVGDKLLASIIKRIQGDRWGVMKVL